MKFLLDLPHTEARELLASGAPVFLPINPVEYHGPHLSLHNDALISKGLARDLHRRLSERHPEWPFLMASDLELGVEPASGMGSRHVSYGAAREIIREACRALCELGAKRVILMTFHGSPLHNLALEAGVELLLSLGVQAFSPLNLVLREMLTLDGEAFAEAFSHIEDPEERQEMIRDLALDFHAGFFETSLALYYAPESVSPCYREVPPCPPIEADRALLRASWLAARAGAKALARELHFAAFGVGWGALRPFPGYTGRPHRATAAAGAFFAEKILERYTAAAEEVFAGRARSPRPIMRWVATASLGGRLGPGRALSGKGSLAALL